MGCSQRKCFCESAHSERHAATDGERRPIEADSSDTPEREVVGGESPRLMNNYQKLVRRGINVLPN